MKEIYFKHNYLLYLMKYLPIPVQSITFNLLKNIKYDINYPNLNDHTNIKYSNNNLFVTNNTNLEYITSQYILKTTINQYINNSYNRYNTRFKTMLINNDSTFLFEDLEITTDNNYFLEYIDNLKKYTLNYHLINDNNSETKYFDKDKPFNHIVNESLKILNHNHF